MKITDFLTEVGRPVAYYPALRRITKSVTASILLCQFLYWRGKQSDPNGWLYKTSAEIEEETGLSYEEQKTARSKLKALGILQEHYARLDHELRFKLNIDAINAAWEGSRTRESHIPEQGNPTFGKKGKPCSYNESEITTESTPEIPPAAEKPAKKDFVDAELEFHLKPKAIKDAFATFFKLTPNWEAKYNRQFLEWMNSQQVTAQQVEQAANLWRTDKRFNWQVPTLKGIQEHWMELTETPSDNSSKLDW